MQQQRNYGIDLLRMVSMLLVVILHVEGHGGVLESAQGHNVYWAYLPEAFAFSAVNVYALVSGYVGVAARWRPANLISLWLQVAFYSVGLTALCGIVFPGTVGLTDLLHAAMPVTYQYVDYWYFTAYFALFFLIPLLNHLVHTMPRRQLRAMLLVLLLVFSVFPTMTRHDRFSLDNGYTVWWLAILYLLGGYVRQYHAFEKSGAAGPGGICRVLAARLCLADGTGYPYPAGVVVCLGRRAVFWCADQLAELSFAHGGAGGARVAAFFRDLCLPSWSISVVRRLRRWHSGYI